MAEILVKAVDAVHPDPEKDRRGAYKKGDIVLAMPDGHVWGSGEGPPTFVRILCPELGELTARDKGKPWWIDLEWEVIAHDPATDSARIRIWSTATSVSGGGAVQLGIDNSTAGVVLLLSAAEVDDTLDNYDSVQAMLAAAGNTEAAFTNYARKTGITITATEDDAGNTYALDIPDQTWTSAGGTTDETLAKLVFAIQTGADDSTLIPVSHQDFTPTTDGSDLTAQINADGVYQAA